MVISGPNKFFQDIIYSIPKLCCHSEGTCCLIIVLLWGFTIWKKKNKDKKQKNPGPRASSDLSSFLDIIFMLQSFGNSNGGIGFI